MNSITPRTEALVKMWRNATEQERTMLGEMHQHYEGEVTRIVQDGNPLHNVAHTLHGLIDEGVAHVLQTPNGRKVQCRKGCAACCSLHVNATEGEAALLLVHVEQAGIAVDWPKVERQAACDFKQWGQQSTSERRCVFLSAEGECTVYEHRPASCRKYHVISDRRHCDTDAYPGHKVVWLASPDAEVITSAMLGVIEAGSLPRMLLKTRAYLTTTNEDDEL